MTSSNRPRRALTIGLAAALTVAVAVAVPGAGAKKAPVKPKPDGAYASPVAAKRGFAAIIMSKGKINSVTMRVKYKDPDGNVCKPEGYPGDLVQLELRPKKPKKPKDGKYSVKVTQEFEPFAGATATVSGKFKSSTKATINIKSTWGVCKTGKVTFNNASYTVGG
jgi:hypothetical protein